MKKQFLDRLGKEWLFWDGGTGSLLQSMGLKGGELPESWNITQPNKIKQLYKEYFTAGSDIVNANTFGVNRLKFPDNLEAVVKSAIRLAIESRTETGREDAFIAVDIGPTGKLLKPLGDLEFEDAVKLFGEVIRLGEEEGADLVLIETMSDSYELKAAVLAAKEYSNLPICATVTFDESKKLLTGGTVKSTVALLEGLRVDALGTNCSLGPKEIIPIVSELVQESSTPIIVTPNAGLPRTENGETVYDVNPEEFSRLMTEIAGMGVQVLGGCCGTTPKHIAKTIDACKSIPFTPVTPKNKTYVTSFAQAVEIGGQTKIIGERINPTGKKRFKEALINEDISYILGEGIKQEDSGAHILDVNVGLPEIDEAAMMERVIGELQAVTALPLQIDTANPQAMERGMRIYNGKPMINSVNGKEESLKAILPLVAKYGGVLVALTLDDSGIPETPEGRLKIAKRIYKAAEEYGIPHKDIVIDGLTLTVSSDKNAALTTLETVSRITEEFKGHTILGVSNVSFGLPRRELINSGFLSMAMNRGLSCAIMNPGSEPMMNAYRSALALLGQDDNCGSYIEAFSDNNGSSHTISTRQDESPAQEKTLFNYIARGLGENAARTAKDLLDTQDALSIINNELIPALDYVGKGFEAGTIFLPQLLMSAEAAKSAFSVIQSALPENANQKKGKIIVATVKGDIHDIGKNIVKVLLENYGFQVMDLGKDVAPEKVVDAVIKNNIKLVGLSALMTTTVSGMQETIKLLREKCPDTKVLVSGAVLNQNYADMIGADHYAKDAMGTVRYAEQIL